jgi:short subunit dehydrogenase-like uncharacterized protein
MLAAMADPRWMIYGANGYTGRLIAAEAVKRGLTPVLAGRSRDAIESMEKELSLDSKLFALGTGAPRALDGIAAVLHCAGPFSHTSRPMVDACLEAGAHYLDITGEIAVFESIFARDEEAKERGVVLLPGVGFDVVPSDCLAANLHAQLADACELSLAIDPRGGSISRGTLKTMIEGLPQGGVVRSNGKIVRVPAAWDVREIPFGIGVRTAMTIPWGDVATAWRTTGIPNIRVYSAVAPKKIPMMRRLSRAAFVLRFPPLMKLALAIANQRRGADEAVRERARVYLWGEVSNASGKKISATMEVPDGYTVTAKTAVASVERVIRGDVAPGAWTPAGAFGSSFIDEALGNR